MASNSFRSAFRSSVFKKVIMAATGLFLVLFVILHMLGNLTFLFGGPDKYNLYSEKLVSLGPLLIFVEIILAAAFFFHAWNAVVVSIENRRARPEKYRSLKSAGKPSKKTLSSTTMIVTGLILLVFLVIHLKTFKYGAYYPTEVNGETVRDLYKLVNDKFQHGVWAFGYIAVMLLLGFHLRHGFWSAFQSLGANHPRYSATIYAVGVIIAIVVAAGFLLVPLVVFFNH